MQARNETFAAVYGLRVTALTPVHVGSAEGELAPFEYVQGRERIWPVSAHALFRLLREEGLFEDYVRYTVETPGGRAASLDGYLDWKGRPTLREDIVRRCALRAIAKPERMDITGAFRTMTTAAVARENDLRRVPYIPGSSLKGAVRVAVLYRMLGKSEEQRRGISAEVAKAAEVLRRASSEADFKRRKQLEKDAAGTVERAGKRMDRLARYGADEPNTDGFRGLRFGDALPAYGSKGESAESLTEAAEIAIVSLNPPGRGGWHFSKARVFAEVLPAGTVLNAELEMADYVWKALRSESARGPSGDLREWLRDAEAKTVRLLEEEIAFYREAGLSTIVRRLEALREQKPTLRLGWGTGLLGTTPSALHMNAAERRMVREVGHFQKRQHDTFPQSRKVVVRSGAPADVLGWVKLEIEGERRL